MTASPEIAAGSQSATLRDGITSDSGGGGGHDNSESSEPVPATVVTTPTDEDGTESTYHLKWIQWNSGKIPIVMQSINGPCPLIATLNVLLLREKVKLPTMLEQITANQLLTYLGECIMDCVPSDIQTDENALINFEQNIHDAMEILPKLKTGLDVNIRFTGITDFEYTPECIIFDLLRIPLYHGWLSDPDLTELQNAIGNQSYNQLVDNIITNKTSIEPETQAKVLIAEEFLEQTASQLTLHGLNELKSNIKDNEIGILFRNNHFLTFLKREDEIYTLVTDHGYLTEDNIIWETLDNIEGAGRFFNSNFQVSEVTNRQVSEFKAIDERQWRIENDFLMALSLNEEETRNQATEEKETCAIPEDDFELAKRLQAEEDRIYEEMIRKRQAREGLQQEQSDKDKQIVPIDHFQSRSETSSSASEISNRSPRDIHPRASQSESSKPVDEWPLLISKPKEEQRPSVTQPGPSSSSSFPVPADIPRPSEIAHKPALIATNPINPTVSPRAPMMEHQSEPAHSRPISSSSHRPSNSRRPKSEKNSKESNCIVN